MTVVKHLMGYHIKTTFVRYGVRECIENYVWLCDLGIELCKEYTHRYGKRHKSQIIEWCMINHPNIEEKGDLTEFRLEAR